VPVRKRDIIALDEDDAMAIIARRLVETNPSFKDPKIAVIASSNIPVGNRVCLTTISSLYDILKLLFMHEIGQRTDRSLRFNRPSDERLDRYEKLAEDYFTWLGKAFKPVGDLLKSKDPAAVTAAQRSPDGGHLLFRPIGLDSVTRVAIELSRKNEQTLADSVKTLKDIPTDLDDAPYRDVIWSPARHTILPSGKVLCRELIRYMVGLPVDEDNLLAKYRISQGVEENDKSVKLPAQVS
jgi:DNA sulfur modification protein DndB